MDKGPDKILVTCIDLTEEVSHRWHVDLVLSINVLFPVLHLVRLFDLPPLRHRPLKDMRVLVELDEIVVELAVYLCFRLGAAVVEPPVDTQELDRRSVLRSQLHLLSLLQLLIV